MNIKSIVVIVLSCASSLCAQYNTFSDAELKFTDGYNKLLEGDAKSALEIFEKEVFENKNHVAVPYYKTAACGVSNKEAPSANKLARAFAKARKDKNSWASALLKKKSFKKHEASITKKANDGNVVAQVELSGAYIHGLVTDKNPDLAFKYMKMAADQGLSCAKFGLGTLYAEGIGVEVDYDKAEELMVASSELNPRKEKTKYLKKFRKKKAAKK